MWLFRRWFSTSEPKTVSEPDSAKMATPTGPKMAAVKTATPAPKVGESVKAKPAGTGKVTPSRPTSSSVKSAPGKLGTGQLQTKPSTGQSGTPKAPGGQSASSKNPGSQSGGAKLTPAPSGKFGKSPTIGKSLGAGKSPSGHPSPIRSSPGNKMSLGKSSPRKSIFGKPVGQSGGMKLASAQSPSKNFFGKPSVVKTPGQFDLPLALRKKRRPNAGMKREAPVFMDILGSAKSPKEGKTAPKRKLSQTSPNANRGSLKNKTDYVPPSSKKRKIVRSNRDQDSRNDFYCWVCHKEGSVICCELCPRVYHPRCAKVEGEPAGDWFCPECERATNAECIDSQSQAMSSLTQDQLAKLLLYALKRMKHTGAEPFLKPVNTQQNPGYEEFVFNPMDLSTLEKNIKKHMYGSTEAFLLDAKWILHNCIVFNGSHHKLTNNARMIIKICEYEMKEIEICPDCYLSASVKNDKWFCEVCRDPHKLVWARLQGFPFWPSKVIREKDGLLDVRFFGQHDRAWVPINSCYMYSPDIPNPSKKKTAGLSTSIMEMELHIENLKRTFGSDCFRYAPHRTPYGKFEALTLDPKDSEKWAASQPTILMNGISDRSSPQTDPAPSTVKVKTEPDSQQACAKPEVVKPSDGMPGHVAKDTVLEKESPGNGKDSSKDSENKSAENGKDAGKDEQADSASTIKDSQAYSAPSTKNEAPTVKRQIFNITRKRPAGVEKTTPVKATSEGSAAGSKSDVGNVESDDSSLSSPSKAPAGVFEVSDESLDVDPEVEAQSPAVQLLGKAHVSTNDFARSLAIKLNKVSPRSLGKIGEQICRDSDKAEDDNLMDQEEQSNELAERETLSKIPENLDKPSVVPNEEIPKADSSPKPSIITYADDKHSKDSSPETPEADSSGKALDEAVPSTSQSIPKDKFHIKLVKTIETMKASLGIDRLHSDDKETSDSESSAADSDSDSSEADHSDDSDMEVNEDHGPGVARKRADSPNRDGSEKATTSREDTSTSLSKSSVEETDSSVDPNGEQLPKEQNDPERNNAKFTQKVVDDGRGPSSSKKTCVDQDIDLVMSCHSEVSDEGELVIDESRTAGKANSASKKTRTSKAGAVKRKHSSFDKPEQSTVALKMVVEEPMPMEADDVILVSDPFESHTTDHTDRSAAQEEKVASPEPTSLEEEPKHEEETKDQDDSKQEEATSLQNKEESRCEDMATTEATTSTSKRLSPTPTDPPGDKSTAVDDKSPPSKDISEDDSQTASTQIEDSKSSTPDPPKPDLPPTNPSQSPTSYLSSFPKIVETLQAAKRLPIVPDPSPKSPDTAVKSPTLTVATKEEAASTSCISETVKEPQSTAKDKDATMNAFYKKYTKKISTSVEGILEEFCSDLSEGMLLKEAKATIEELKGKVQQLTWERDQERKEFKQIMDLAVAEMKECMKEESKVALINLKNQLEAEKQDEIRKTKTKQWCASCGKDAVFFCCWNTSYCDYPCQQSHWAQHRNTCQQRVLGNNAGQQQQQQQAPNKQQQIPASSTTTAPSTSDITQIVSPASGKSAAEQLRLISEQQAHPASTLANQPNQPVPMQLHSNVQPSIQQQINQVANHQPLHPSQISQSPNQPLHPGQLNQANQQQQQPPLHQALQQQVQQVMQPQLTPNSQPMQTLIQYVQAPRMSAPVPVRQMLQNRHPFSMSQGRIIGNGMRVVRP